MKIKKMTVNLKKKKKKILIDAKINGMWKKMIKKAARINDMTKNRNKIAERINEMIKIRIAENKKEMI